MVRSLSFALFVEADRNGTGYATWYKSHCYVVTRLHDWPAVAQEVLVRPLEPLSHPKRQAATFLDCHHELCSETEYLHMVNPFPTDSQKDRVHCE